MITSILTAILSVIVLITGWLIVQTLWRKVFREYISDEDVLAERRSCKNCGCTEACIKPQNNE